MDRRGHSTVSQVKQETQSLNCFPNEPTKQIDYVIEYKYFDEYQLRTDKRKFRMNKIRELFFDKLEREQFEIYTINFKTKGEDHVYALLHCSTERLLEEADALNFEMKLKNCRLDDLEKITGDEKKHFSAVFDKLKDNNEEAKDGNVPSAKYDPFINYMFEGVTNKEDYPMGPFSNNTRMVLVDSILNNTTFMNDQEVLKYRTEEKIKNLIMGNKSDGDNASKSEVYPVLAKGADPSAKQKDKLKNGAKGIMYMVQDKYFVDAFVLHDESERDVNFINELINHINYKQSEDSNSKKLNEIIVDTDIRQDLKKKWASVKRVLFFQPTWEIREYFGEANAFYFAWLGTFISTLWIPAAIGIAFSIYGLKIGIDRTSDMKARNLTATVEYYTNVFLYSFDNDMMPWFSITLVVWGMLFTEYWSRLQTKLAFKWDTDSFNDCETDLPDFFRKAQRRKHAWRCTKALLKHENKFKKVLSYLVLIGMVGAVAMSIAAVVIFRVWIKTKVFPTDQWGQLFIGDVGSVAMSISFIGLLNVIYTQIAYITTKWENHRTLSKFNNNLVLKLFVFRFANNYGSLFYLAYFRQIEYSNGFFNMGAEYVDACKNDYCTPLLTAQLMVGILAATLPNIGFHAVLPWFAYRNNLKKIKNYIEQLYEPSTSDNEVDGKEKITPENLNEKCVQYYISIEREKEQSLDTIREQYLEKTALYGYMIIFGCVFSLAPAVILIILLFNLRFISNGFLMYHRRPVGHKAQDIGMWLWIHRFLNVAGIANLSFYTSLKSTWASKESSIIGNSDTNRYAMIVVAENASFFVWILIIYLLPRLPTKIQNKQRLETDYVKKIVSVAKQIETHVDHADRFNLVEDEELKEFMDDYSEYESETEEEEDQKPRSRKVHPQNEA